VHAIVLVDAARELVALTADNKGCPVGVLLPIANKPMISYVLETLSRSGIVNVTLVRANFIIFVLLHSWVLSCSILMRPRCVSSCRLEVMRIPCVCCRNGVVPGIQVLAS
jgi:hypothetical protein